MMRKMLRALALLLVVAAGCDDDSAAADLSSPADLSASAHPVQLTVGDRVTPLAAWYSIFIEPFEAANPGQADLVVTFIDPAFTCAGPTGGLDSLSFQFLARLPGVTSNFVLARSGPDLASLVGGGTGGAELTAVDDRYMSWDADGGTVSVGAGGMVSGTVHWTDGNVTVDGTFTAPHCAALDFAAAP
jgi:hypothetical protein